MQEATSSKNTKELDSSFRLERAKEHVLRNWLPINHKLLDELRQELDNPENIHTVDSLLVKIKTDMGLFLHCLQVLIEEHRNTLESEINPINLFYTAGVERLKAIIKNPNLDKNVHSFENMSENQVAALQHAFVSASAAEAISEKQDIESDYGFLVQILRSLGENLIAWNYPKTYSRIVGKKVSLQEIDQEFFDALGFTPQLLALSLIRDWGLNGDICYALGDDTEGFYKTGNSLRRICDLSDKIAIANDPAHYLNAKETWEEVKVKINNILGANGVGLIQQRVHVNCAGYIDSYPEMFGTFDDFNPENHIITLEQMDPMQRNQWIRFCSGQSKELLISLYSGFGKKVNRNDLLTLVKEIIPQIGFTGGCIYTLDQRTNLLMPRVKIGNTRLLNCKPLPYQDELKRESSPIIMAYSCNSPIIKTGVADDMGYVGFIASVFGGSRKVGVLYLEMPDSRFRTTSQYSVQQFKAILQALNDSLHLQ